MDIELLASLPSAQLLNNHQDDHDEDDGSDDECGSNTHPSTLHDARRRERRRRTLADAAERVRIGKPGRPVRGAARLGVISALLLPLLPDARPAPHALHHCPLPLRSPQHLTKHIRLALSPLRPHPRPHSRPPASATFLSVPTTYPPSTSPHIPPIILAPLRTRPVLHLCAHRPRKSSPRPLAFPLLAAQLSICPPRRYTTDPRYADVRIPPLPPVRQCTSPPNAPTGPPPRRTAFPSLDLR